jgi:hypothetical protein
MSVWKSVKNNTMEKAVDMDMLTKALAEMGVTLDFTVNNISNTWGHETCSAAFVRNGRVLSLGINVDDKGGVSLVGDTYGTGLGGDGKQDSLMNRIAQLYNSELYQERLTAMGYNITSVTKNEKGELVISAIQY